ncbi:hypothetical protein DY000_02059846 [Brassica cretica]|uniref:Uncharacterized protein n=1 Tax=Brassica cretica TaxID=69181 RepID=A0ABQ7B336_BRACR|nr:hypothetical protein DY000_02059846 [Brassica cretica]
MVSYQNKIPKACLCQALNPSVVNSSILLADLKAGCCSNTAEVPLLIFREAKNVKKGGQLTGVHMLLLKEKSILIQVPPLNTFKNLSREGGMYGCMVLMPLEARFTDHTSFVESVDWIAGKTHLILSAKQNWDELDDFNAWLDISTLNQIRKVATEEM